MKTWNLNLLLSLLIFLGYEVKLKILWLNRYSYNKFMIFLIIFSQFQLWQNLSREKFKRPVYYIMGVLLPAPVGMATGRVGPGTGPVKPGTGPLTGPAVRNRNRPVPYGPGSGSRNLEPARNRSVPARGHHYSWPQFSENWSKELNPMLALLGNRLG